MTNKASRFLKQIITTLTSMAKAKTNAIRNRLIIFSLLSNKRFFMSSLSHKLQNLASQRHHKIKSNDDDDDDNDDDQFDDDNGGGDDNDDDDDNGGGEVVQEEANHFDYGSGDSDDKYPNVTHSLSNDEDLDHGGSVIDLVKNSKPEGEEFRLEDEIDRVADLFIRKFHRQMRLQKQLSLKNYEDMLQRSV